MSAEAHAHPQPNYMMVFYALFAITVAEVGVTYLTMPPAIMIIILLVMAFVKAAMVAAYFMHLRYDNIVLSIIAVVPLILACIAIAILSYEFTHDIPPLPPIT
jgi:cytochrome c oxidase subunit IV